MSARREHLFYPAQFFIAARLHASGSALPVTKMDLGGVQRPSSLLPNFVLETFSISKNLLAEKEKKTLIIIYIYIFPRKAQKKKVELF